MYVHISCDITQIFKKENFCFLTKSKLGEGQKLCHLVLKILTPPVIITILGNQVIT